MSRPNRKLIINYSVKGSIHTPHISPYIPIRPDEIAQPTDRERL